MTHRHQDLDREIQLEILQTQGEFPCGNLLGLKSWVVGGC